MDEPNYGSVTGANQDKIKTTRPITILQIKKAKANDDQTFIIDNKEVNNVVVVGVVRSMVKNDMFTSYYIEDGTGAIDVRLFEDRLVNLGIQIDMYVQVHGRLRSFNNQNTNIVANSISVIKDFNQITYHLLDVIHTHLILGHETRTMDQIYMGEDDIHVAAVKKAILECSNTEAGAYIHTVVVHLKERMIESDIMDTINNLLNLGEIYTTKDDHHLKLA